MPDTSPACEDDRPTTIELRNAFTVEWHGTAISKEGYARLHSALSGIQTINALIFQAAIDKDCTNGLELNNSVVIGLTQAISACTDYVQNIIDGEGIHSKAIEPSSPDYLTLDRLVSGRPAKV